MKVEHLGRLTAREASSIDNLIAVPRCPICDAAITETRVDPRGVEVPYCCGFFLVPVWSCPVLSVLQIRFAIMTDEISPETNIVNEIPESDALTDMAVATPNIPMTPENLVEPLVPPSEENDTNTPTVGSDTAKPQHNPSPPPQATKPESPEAETSKHISEHKDVIGQIRAFYAERGVSVAKTQEVLRYIGCSRVSLNNAFSKLVAAGEFQKVSKGYYEIVQE